MTQAPFRPEHLLVVTSDIDDDYYGNTIDEDEKLWISQQRDVTFLVKSAPKLGSLLFRKDNGRLISEVKNFTQMDVNESRVLYKHEKPFSNLMYST